ncbi:BrnA antitoxin family protein [Desulfosarcina sp.]|nr:BrnA antitoxin family protein [Desulfosarcina sp.]
MKNTAKKKKLSADEIAEMAMNGEDISQYFTNKGQMKPAIQRVNVDFSVDMLRELDALAKELNISRQAVIKTYLRQSIDQHYLARKAAIS